MPGQVVDAEIAAEFMRETLEKVSPDELSSIAAQLRTKSDFFVEHLEPTRLEQATHADLRGILRNTFSTRRKADDMLAELGVPEFGAAIGHFLRGDGSLPERFEKFQSFLAPFPQAAFELPSEILHFAHPEHYWLWARWMWDPRTETGALALVTDDDFDFDDQSPGNTYFRVGQAVAFVSETGHSAGFASFDDSPFGVDVFLGCVYAIYMYTVLRLRMTQEFNRIVPQQPELVRRLLGVHRMEV